MQAQATLTSPIIANIFDGHAALCPSYKSNDVNQIASLTRQEILGDMFYTGSLGYFAQLNALTRIAAISSNAHYQLASGYGTFSYEPNVDYLFGMPIGIRAGGISLDIPINVITATNDGNKENKKNFKIQTGLLMSALEHSTPGQIGDRPRLIDKLQFFQLCLMSQGGKDATKSTNINTGSALAHHSTG